MLRRLSRLLAPTYGPFGETAPTILQLPSRNLWTVQPRVSLQYIHSSSFVAMLARLRYARQFFCYPSLCGSQIGWGFAVFVLWDDSCWVNPQLLSMDRKVPTCWAWEPCASSSVVMHFIERPSECRIAAHNEIGEKFDVTLTGMKARMVQHEMDHMDGILFSRRIPDCDHAVPLDGFYSMSDWPDDYPSIEARSTYFYNLYYPETEEMVAEYVPNSNMLVRKFEEEVFPGMDLAAELINSDNARNEQLHRLYQDRKRRDMEEAMKEKEPYVEDPSSHL